MSEWKEINIGSLGEVVTGNTPLTSNRDFYGGPYPFIKPTDMEIDRRHVDSWEETYSEKAFQKYNNAFIPKGSTGVVTIGTVGEKLFQADQPCFTNQSVNVIIPHNENFDADFIYYLMKYNLPQVSAANPGTASGRHHVSKSNFCAIKVQVPIEIKYQRRIASILSAYDDLIENNLKRIKLLEESMQIILAKLIKDANSSSDFIYPKIADFDKGFEPGSNNYEEENCDGLIPFFRVGDLSTRDSKLYISSDLKGIKLAQSEDILISMDGSIGIVSIGINGAYSSGIRKVEVKNQLYKGLVYSFLKSPIGQSQIMTYAKGSTILHASSCIPKLNMVLPCEHKFNRELELSNSGLQQIINLIAQNKKLKESRDILLPKLMSGKINVA